MKVTVAMDSFKGSLTSLEAGNAVRDGILLARPDAEVTVLPTADGGEGTLDAIAPFIGAAARPVRVRGPLGEIIDSYYIFSDSDSTAYIEMSKASGITLVPEKDLDICNSSTFGTGELIRDAISKGFRRIVVFLGGSATNDGGAGMLSALGGRFLDKDGKPVPYGATGLSDLCSIDTTGLIGTDIAFIAATDVTNPLCGPSGASHVYGPQKGATYEMAEKMDLWLMNMAKLAGADPDVPGYGAAGGCGFALMHFLGAKLESGADIVAKITGLEDAVRDCDIVITGEGRMDGQTINGKAPYRIMKTAARYGKRTIGVCGITGEGWEKCLAAGFDQVVPLKDPSMEKDSAIISVAKTVADLFAADK